MKNFLYLVIFLCAYSLHVAGADHTIYLLDFRYLNKYDLHDPAKVRSIWDLLHAAATLQGVVNRESPRLYIR